MGSSRHRRGVARLLATLGAALVVLLGFVSPAAASPASQLTTFHAWSGADLALGQFDGAQLALANGRVAVTLRPGDSTGTWTSPVYRTGVPIGDLVSSWQAQTPAGSWIETQLSVQVTGHWSSWFVMGDWAFDTSIIQRHSVDGQSNADGTIYTDTYVAGDNGPPGAYRLREVLHGNGSVRPLVFQLAATTSDLSTPPPTSATTMTKTVDLPVPTLSQMTHAGEYPAFGGGGEVWCSPTSTAMVMAYWHRGPSPAELATLPADPVFDANGRQDAQVDWAAIHTWDVTYGGTGNWPFNAAYASAYGLNGSVRQYESLVSVEQWIKRGVPIVVSIAWDNTNASTDDDLTGAPISESGGHLMVVRGFTASGDVIANDPAAPSNALVRRVYQRGQFERDWLDFGSGTTYVIQG